MKYVPAILAAAALSACSQAPRANQSAARPAAASSTQGFDVASAQPVEQNSARVQLAAFQLQTACAREARAWFNERQRNEGNPTPWRGFTSILVLGEAHYSLAQHACYAAVDEQTTISSGRQFVLTDSHKLYRVDGDLEPIAEISGATSDPKEALIGAGAVLVRDIKSCTVANHKCDSLAVWQRGRAPTLRNELPARHRAPITPPLQAGFRLCGQLARRS